MEISFKQVRTILDNLQKLDALGLAIGHLCDGGVPTDNIMCGWQLLLWDVEKEIHRIIEPKSAK